MYLKCRTSIYDSNKFVNDSNKFVNDTEQFSLCRYKCMLIIAMFDGIYEPEQLLRCSINSLLINNL